MQLSHLRQLATRSALLLSLGLVVGSCNKATDVQPSNSLDASAGYATRDDATAGLLGAYDALQSSDYNGLAYPSLAGLISGEIRFVGTFTTTYGVVGQNQVLPDNIQIGNTWNIIYNGINRVNYLLQQVDRINDPAFTTKNRIIAEARALRAYHYMNLIGFWGGNPQGFGYSGGLGVPLRLTPATSIGNEVAPIPRSSEEEVAKAIRDDLDFAIANLPVGTGSRINKNAALALRARFELRMRNYASALSFAQQVPAINGFATSEATGTSAPDAIWQLVFSNTDQSQYAFYWYPSPGGRNEFDPSTALASAHPTGDRRRAINAVTTASTATVGGNQYTLAVGTTQKYYRTASRDDAFNAVRYAEVALTVAEAAARTGDLTTAVAQNNIIRVRAGLLPLVIGTPPTPAPSPAVAAYITPSAADPTGSIALVQDILLQRRLELAHEGQYWFDLRRTNTVQTALPTYTQTFRNLFPIPNREVTLTNGLIAQNPQY
jgi:hypothetical protein